MRLKKDAIFHIAKEVVTKRNQAKLSSLPNRLAALALTPSDETIENIAHEIVEEVQEAIIEKHSTSQSNRAKKSRSPKNYEGMTRDEVIAALWKHHRGDKPGEVWEHLGQALEDWGVDACREVPHKNRDSQSYQYILNGKPDAISFKAFRSKPRM